MEWEKKNTKANVKLKRIKVWFEASDREQARVREGESETEKEWKKERENVYVTSNTAGSDIKILRKSVFWIEWRQNIMLMSEKW